MKQGGHNDFTWFGPSKRNTLRPWDEFVLLCVLQASIELASKVLKWYERTFLLKLVAARSLYRTGPGSYMQTRGPTGGPGVVDTLLQ
jgi:hypothetical protein